MTTWVSPSKTSGTWASPSKTQSEVIYFVSEVGDFYLVGSAENEFLITQDVVNWNNQNKS